MKSSHPINIEAAVEKAKETLEAKEKQIKEMEDAQRQSQNKFISMTKKLSLERDEAVKAKDEIQDQIGGKLTKLEDITAEIKVQINVRNQEIDLLVKERDNLKEVTFNLMYEKQKADPNIDCDHRVDVGEALQQEYDANHPPKDPSKEEVQTLLRFSNGQIKKLSAELQRLKREQPQDADA